MEETEMARRLDYSKTSAYYKARRAAGEGFSRAYDSGHLDGQRTGYRQGYDQGYKDSGAGRPHRFDSRKES